MAVRLRGAAGEIPPWAVQVPNGRRDPVSGQMPVRRRTAKGPYFNAGSTAAGATASKPPAYPTHRTTNASAKLQ